MANQWNNSQKKLKEERLNDQDRTADLAQQLPGDILKEDIHPAFSTLLIVPANHEQIIPSFLNFRQDLVHDETVTQGWEDRSRNARFLEDLHTPN
jgi:hypothetical protein